MKRKEVKPFLKWAGGKTQLLADIEARFPFAKTAEFTFVEPFVGSGAVLFWVLNNFPGLQAAVINDVNHDLINVYRVIQSDVSGLISLLGEYQEQYHALDEQQELKKEFYYASREQFNARNSEALVHAALFIFLNRTCFNGLYRVHRKNSFNVPVGSYKKPRICDEENLLAVADRLQKVTILSGDFEATLQYADTNAFFYLDPPYKPLTVTSSFNAYAREEFGDDEQVRLKHFCDQLTAAGGRWLLSNSDVRAANPEDNFFDRLYSDYSIRRVSAKRNINSKSGGRGNITELLIADRV